MVLADIHLARDFRVAFPISEPSDTCYRPNLCARPCRGTPSAFDVTC
jgi:hypothetical protein